jgi:hypothetical protein
MMDPTKDFERRRLQQRRVELRNQIHEISGGEAQFGPAGEGLSLEQEVAFLEHLVSMETAPRTTWLDRLQSAGYEMPDPGILSDEEIGLEVWQVIQRISELHGFLYSTDHLSDRELYEHLFHHTLRNETLDLPPGSDTACSTLDLIGSGSKDDVDCWLRYYADEEERTNWIAEFPDDPLPPAEKPPYNRDHLLPKRDYPESPLAKILDELLAADWEDTDGPVQFAGDLTEVEIAGTPHFVTTRAMLTCLRDGGPVKATAKLGNLPRALVKQIFPLLPYTEEELNKMRSISKIFDEEDLHLVYAARLTCQTAGLLRKHKGHFTITKKGTKLLAPDRAGELFRSLFLAYFRKINLAYFDGMPEFDGIQLTLPVILWRLGVVARDWTPIEKLMKETILPDVIEEITEHENRPYWTPGSSLDIRLWRHLADFGLLESAEKESVRLPNAYRITPLYDRFIHFPFLPGA